MGPVEKFDIFIKTLRELPIIFPNAQDIINLCPHLNDWQIDKIHRSTECQFAIPAKDTTGKLLVAMYRPWSSNDSKSFNDDENDLGAVVDEDLIPILFIMDESEDPDENTAGTKVLYADEAIKYANEYFQ